MPVGAAVHGRVVAREGGGQFKAARKSAGSNGRLAVHLLSVICDSEVHDVPPEAGRLAGSVVVVVDWVLVIPTVRVDSDASSNGIMIWDIL